MSNNKNMEIIMISNKEKLLLIEKALKINPSIALMDNKTLDSHFDTTKKTITFWFDNGSHQTESVTIKRKGSLESMVEKFLFGTVGTASLMTATLYWYLYENLL